MDKHQILQTIIKIFDKWSNEQSDLQPACRQGCNVCCTQSVTITALEGENILRFILKEPKSAWFATQISSNRKHERPRFTTNDFAKACLEERDLAPQSQNTTAVCPFLEDDSCSIYPVRPFSCRLFISSSVCKPNQPATVPNYYFEASTAVTQIIEHLGQKEYWGNMLDVLPALLDISEFKEIGEKMNTALTMQARMQTLTAKPLPGFLLSEDEGGKVVPLLETIFQTEVAGKSIEDILNGN